MGKTAVVSEKINAIGTVAYPEACKQKTDEAMDHYKNVLTDEERGPFLIFKIIEKRSVNRYNLIMTFLDLLADKKTTVYALSSEARVPKTTLADIASGKADILECSGKTLLAISRCLGITIEDLLSLEREEAKTTMPLFLCDSISDYRKAIRKNSTLVDCYCDQLNSSINVAEVEHLITKELADRLRKRYFGVEKGD